MAQLPLPSNLPSAPLSPPILPLSPPVLEEQLELAMVSPSNSRAVAVYCAASFGHQKAYQLAALCKSLIARLIGVPLIIHSLSRRFSHTAVAHALVEANRPLIYGGGKSGIMGVVSGAVANSEGGKVTGIIPYAILAAGGEKDKGHGQPKSNSIAELLDEKRRGEVRIPGSSDPPSMLTGPSPSSRVI